MTLETFLVSELFTFLMIFVRVGAGVMVLPGIAEGYVSPRVRLLFALTASLAIMPIISPLMPAVPGSPLTLIIFIVIEIFIGIFFGLMSRILISTMHTVGMIMSYQAGLASASMFDFTQAGQGSAIGNMLSMLAVILLFATNLHHLMLQGLFDSYTLFPPGEFVPPGDMLEVISRLVGDTFKVAVKLASPIIVLGLIIYLGMGVLSRLMPNMHVFFVIIPPQILISFMLIMMVLSGLMLWYMRYIEEHLMLYIP